MRILLNIVQLSLSSIRSTGILRTAPLRPTISYRYKWTHRRHVAILNEKEVFDTDNTETTVTKPSKVHRRAKARNEKHKKQEEKRIIKKEEDKHLEEEESEATENDRVTAVKQTYTSLKGNEKFISSIMIEVRTKKREKCDLMLLEGLRLIQDAIRADVTPKMIFFNRLSDIQQLSLPEEVQVYKVPYRTIQLWSVLTTSPGIMGIFEIPDTADKKPSKDCIPLTIICDNIREPGNLGTIVRAAAAVGCEKLLLMKGCTDLWDSKVLRSAMGAHFRIPILTSISWDEIPTIINDESAIFLADNSITYENKFEDDRIVDDSDVYFDESSKDENNRIVDDSDMDFDESSKEDEIDQLIDKRKTKNTTAKIKSLVKQLTSQLPVEPYHMLQYTQKEVVLVVGGETEGVSLESCKLLRARNCIRVNVPLTNDIDSLNVGVAVGIITFEIRRQFITRKMEVLK